MQDYGRPCMQSGGSKEACTAKATPPVKACMVKAMTAAHGRPNIPLPLPTEESDPQLVLKAPSVGFVAPPRTIRDITAILDAEKPDPKKIEERKARADAKTPANIPPSELARFYYDRGNARSELWETEGSDRRWGKSH